MDDKKIKMLLVWIFNVVGVLVAMIFWKGDKYLKKLFPKVFSLFAMALIAIVVAIVPIIGWIASLVIGLANLFVYAYGILQIVKGEELELPSVYANLEKNFS